MEIRGGQLARGSEPGIAMPVQPLVSNMDAHEVLSRLQREGVSRLPVVEAGSRRMLGVARYKIPAAKV